MEYWDNVGAHKFMSLLKTEMTQFIQYEQTAVSNSTQLYNPLPIFRVPERLLPRALAVNPIDSRYIAVAALDGIREINIDSALRHRLRSHDFTHLLVIFFYFI